MCDWEGMEREQKNPEREERSKYDPFTRWEQLMPYLNSDRI